MTTRSHCTATAAHAPCRQRRGQKPARSSSHSAPSSRLPVTPGLLNPPRSSNEVPKQDLGCLRDKTDGLGWQKGLFSLRRVAGSCSTAPNLSPALRSPAPSEHPQPTRAPPGCQPVPRERGRRGSALHAMLPCVPPNPVPDPPWEGVLPKAMGVWCGSGPCPPLTGRQSTDSALADT